MNGLFGAIATLFFLLTGCNQQPDNTSAVKQTAYQWEKAYVNQDYPTQQKLLYEAGTYEVNATAKKQNAELKENDIRYQIYFDQQAGWYDVITTYDNPLYGNKIYDKLVIRQKGNEWKVDEEKSLSLQEESLTQIQNQTKQMACINCSK
jgi:hypothetical protein